MPVARQEGPSLILGSPAPPRLVLLLVHSPTCRHQLVFPPLLHVGSRSKVLLCLLLGCAKFREWMLLSLQNLLWPHKCNCPDLGELPHQRLFCSNQQDPQALMERWDHFLGGLCTIVCPELLALISLCSCNKRPAPHSNLSSTGAYKDFLLGDRMSVFFQLLSRHCPTRYPNSRTVQPLHGHQTRQEPPHLYLFCSPNHLRHLLMLSWCLQGLFPCLVLQSVAPLRHSHLLHLDRQPHHERDQ